MPEESDPTPAVLLQYRDTGAWGDRQGAFARALLDPDLPVPAGLIDPQGKSSGRRFAVYRNNVVVGLIDALKASYPAILCLVGEDFFAAMARVYVKMEPPPSPIMLDYGAGFPAFIERFEPASMLVYLADVARLERSWLEAYHAAEASPLHLSAFTKLRPDDLPWLRLVLHPSVRIVRSTFPIVHIWHVNISGGTDGEIEPGHCGNDVLIVRPEAQVEVRRLPAGVAVFIHALQSRASIIEAAQAATMVDADFDLVATLQAMVELEMIIGYDLQSHRSAETI